MAWVDLTGKFSVNQWNIKYQKTVNQDLGGSEIPHLIWLLDICSHNISFCIVITKCLTFSVTSSFNVSDGTGNTKGGTITVPLTSCLTGLESAL
jgi:hypothetical protein